MTFWRTVQFGVNFGGVGNCFLATDATTGSNVLVEESGDVVQIRRDYGIGFSDEPPDILRVTKPFYRPVMKLGSAQGWHPPMHLQELAFGILRRAARI